MIRIHFTDYILSYHALMLARQGLDAQAKETLEKKSCPIHPFNVVGIWHAVTADNVDNARLRLIEEIRYNPITGECDTTLFDVARNDRQSSR